MRESSMQFIEAARFVALTAGKTRDFPISKANVGGCTFDLNSALVYGDQIMEIIASPSNPELHITRLSNDNPVVWVDSKGEIVRLHDEFLCLYKYLTLIHKKTFQVQNGALGEILSRMKDHEFDRPTKGTDNKNLTIKEFCYSEIKPLLGCENRGVFNYRGRDLTYGLSSPRLVCFKRSPVCVGCGREGVLFRLELPAYSSVDQSVSPHLNLYSVDGVLMTHDHIIPKSKYEKVTGTRSGVNSQSNLQTMCTHCNGKKGDTLPEGLEGELK
jgi:hypothetical protein